MAWTRVSTHKFLRWHQIQLYFFVILCSLHNRNENSADVRRVQQVHTKAERIPILMCFIANRSDFLKSEIVGLSPWQSLHSSVCCFFFCREIGEEGKAIWHFYCSCVCVCVLCTFYLENKNNNPRLLRKKNLFCFLLTNDLILRRKEYVVCNEREL